MLMNEWALLPVISALMSKEIRTWMFVALRATFSDGVGDKSGSHHDMRLSERRTMSPTTHTTQHRRTLHFSDSFVTTIIPGH